MFKFTGAKHPVYWIYGFKRGAFWPFVPTGEDQKRDNAEELELKAKLEKELPIEQDLTRWFGALRRTALSRKANECPQRAASSVVTGSRWGLTPDEPVSALESVPKA